MSEHVRHGHLFLSDEDNLENYWKEGEEEKNILTTIFVYSPMPSGVTWFRFKTHAMSVR